MGREQGVSALGGGVAHLAKLGMHKLATVNLRSY